jgi:hypothetical protein
MKGSKVLYWVTTLFIFLFQGVMPLFTFNSELAKEGAAHLGYPEYFTPMLVVFTTLGALALVIPQVKGVIKEWAYAGFSFLFIAAAISHAVVDGVGPEMGLGLICLGILLLSYVSYHKLKGKKA